MECAAVFSIASQFSSISRRYSGFHFSISLIISSFKYPYFLVRRRTTSSAFSGEAIFAIECTIDCYDEGILNGVETDGQYFKSSSYL